MAFLLVGCTPAGKAVESDSGFKYSGNPSLPVDEAIYTVTGVVIGDVRSVTETVWEKYWNSDGSRGVIYNTDGKGFVRLWVEKSDWPGVSPEQALILKTTDSKAQALQPGDRVTFLCRQQAEALAAVWQGQTYNPSDVTIELDFCRMASPVIGTGNAPALEK